MYIYIWHDPHYGAVKIGFTTNTPQQRMEEYASEYKLYQALSTLQSYMIASRSHVKLIEKKCHQVARQLGLRKITFKGSGGSNSTELFELGVTEYKRVVDMVLAAARTMDRELSGRAAAIRLNLPAPPVELGREMKQEYRQRLYDWNQLQDCYLKDQKERKEAHSTIHYAKWMWEDQNKQQSSMWQRFLFKDDREIWKQRVAENEARLARPEISPPGPYPTMFDEDQ